MIVCGQMAQVLVVYGTTEGHTRLIAETIVYWLQEDGHQASALDASKIEGETVLNGVDRVIVAGSIHQGKHQPALAQFVIKERNRLSSLPTAFLSVSLTAQLDDAQHQGEVRMCVDRFFEETGWSSPQVLCVAGALKYSQYDWMKRALMKAISAQYGGDTDTSQDYVYTDWDELRQFVTDFMVGEASRNSA